MFVEHALSRLDTFRERLAISDGSRQFQFDQFSRAIGSLSQRIAATVEPDAVVALYMERSAELLVAMCACLASGRCFVPIGPDNGTAYNDTLLRACDVRLLMHATNANLGTSFSNVLAVDLNELTKQGVRVLPNRTEPTSLAYLLCTSGSTGVPKPVMVTRSGLDNYLEWATRHYAIAAIDGAVAQLAPTFDAFITLSLLPLLNGKAVHAVPPGEELALLPTMLAALSGTWLIKLTPGQLLVLRPEDTASSFSALTGELVLGGEALTAVHVEKARALFPRLKIQNEYGPTETVVGSTVHQVSHDDPTAARVPIGLPIDRTDVLIIADDGRICAGEEVGEIAIGGAGLARGYLRLPAVTATAFRPHPDAKRPGERIYHTGDYGYRDRHGVLHYLGRRDSQVKIRGQRVDIADIECRVASIECVQRVSVDMYADAAGDNTLVAYVQLRAGATLEEARSQCAARLPGSMLPSRWHAVDTIPLTSHGKVDYSRLRTTASTTQIMLSNLDPSGQFLHQVWRQLLGHTEFGPDDSFFSVGGHSLLTVRLRTRLKLELSVNISLAALVANPTFRGMAKLITDAPRAASTPAPHTVPTESFPLSPMQLQIWVALSQLRAAGHPDPYFTPAAVKLSGALQVDRLRGAIDRVVARHGAFRLQFSAQPTISQSMGATPRLRLDAQIAANESQAVEQLTTLATEHADAFQDALLRIHVISVSDRTHFVLIRSHHLVSDQWSMQLLIREICALYRGDALPDAPSLDSYRQYCTAEPSSEALQASLRFWCDRLAAVTTAPVRASLPAAEQRNARLTVDFDSHATGTLVRRAAAAGHTLNTVMMTVAAISLGALDNLPGIRLATAIAQRDPEYQHTVGCFMNSLCLSILLPAEASLWQTVSQLHADIAACLSHAFVPYPLVVANAPALQNGEPAHARFVFVDNLATDVQLPDCHAEPVELPPADSAKFPLMISVQCLTSERVVMQIDFDGQRHARAAIESLARAMRLTFSMFADDPQQQLADLKRKLQQDREGALAAQTAALSSSIAAARRRRVAAATRQEPARVTQPEWLRGATLIESNNESRSLLQWLAASDECRKALFTSGAVLLRGFQLCDSREFEQAVALATGDSPQNYENRSTPRRRVHNNIFTSTEYPASAAIPPHNENSFSHAWPAGIAFLCVEPALEAGETPIVDSRRVYDSIPETLRAEFARRHVAYLRTFGAAGLSWQETFGTDDVAEVDAYCAANGIEQRWLSPTTLQIRQVLPACRAHPRTSQIVWFNQAHLFHVSNLGTAAQDALAVYGEDKLPRHATFGDGGEISTQALETIRDVYEQHAAVFVWKRGDVVVLDNMLWAHGRRPFRGERRVLVGMTRALFSEASSTAGVLR